VESRHGFPYVKSTLPSIQIVKNGRGVIFLMPWTCKHSVEKTRIPDDFKVLYAAIESFFEKGSKPVLVGV
jgi:hypothetical protein